MKRLVAVLIVLAGGILAGCAHADYYKAMEAKVKADAAVVDAEKDRAVKKAAVDALLAAVAQTFTIRTCVKG